MFERLDAVRFDRIMSSGKNRPMLLACETGLLDSVEVVAKFSHGGENGGTGGLIREAFCSMLASDLGVPVPAPFVVTVSEAFIDAIEHVEAKTMLTRSCRLGFGSHRLPPGFATWTGASASLPGHLLQTAADIFAFDCMISNADRTSTNANLLSDGRCLAAIDHEYGLMGAMNLGWRAPWIAGALCTADEVSRHVLMPALRAASSKDLIRLQVALATVTPERINAYAKALPSEWVDAAPEAPGIACDIIQGLHQNAAALTAEVLRAMA